MLLFRYDDQFVVANFDSAPTADSEIYNKLDKRVRDAHESQVNTTWNIEYFFVNSNELMWFSLKYRPSDLPSD